MNWKEYRKTVTQEEFTREVLYGLSKNVKDTVNTAITQKTLIDYPCGGAEARKAMEILETDIQSALDTYALERQEILLACMVKVPYLVEPENEDKVSNLNHLICELRHYIGLNGYNKEISNFIHRFEDEFNKLIVERHEEG